MDQQGLWKGPKALKVEKKGNDGGQLFKTAETRRAWTCLVFHKRRKDEGRRKIEVLKCYTEKTTRGKSALKKKTR